jgi:multidrug resistance efflux pump
VRLRPIASAIALVLLFAALPVGGFFGYLYRDYTVQLAATDDAYTAPGSLAISEASDRTTAASVTDNQHVVTGGVIVRQGSSNDRSGSV